MRRLAWRLSYLLAPLIVGGCPASDAPGVGGVDGTSTVVDAREDAHERPDSVSSEGAPGAVDLVDALQPPAAADTSAPPLTHAADTSAPRPTSAADTSAPRLADGEIGKPGGGRTYGVHPGLEGLPRIVPSFAPLFRVLAPSVVNIYTQEVMQRRLFGVAPGEDTAFIGTSLGSGLVLDDDGHLLTNAHVVENAAEIRVRFISGEEVPARLVGLDPVRDLALLKVDGVTDLRPVLPGDSDAVQVGDWVVAIGNPLGLSHTMTKGIVSGKGRSEFVSDRVGYLDLIQTDAPIKQGSSGGPLFDMGGRVVGVNTAVNASGRGIGFAIPWNDVVAALARLRQGGDVSRSWLGVYPVAVVGAGAGGPAPAGVMVDAVVDDSPAARAALKPGDVILALDGKPVEEVAEFRLRIATAVAGQEVTLDVVRDGEALKVLVRLEEARDVR